MAIEKEVNIKVNTSQAQSGLNNLEKSIDGVDNSIKDTNASTQAMGNTLDKATGGAVTKFKALKGALQTAVTGFKSLRVAIIGTGIGALLIAITSVASAFRSSEEGQNKFAKLMGVIGSVVGNLTDLLSDLGENIIEAFENPQKAWDSFTSSLNDGYQFIKSQVVDRFKASWDILSGGFEAGVLKMRIAWNEFTGDSEEAEQLKVQLGEVNQKIREGVKTIKNANDQIVGLYEGAKDSIKAFGAEIAADAKAAQDIADKRAKADKLERDLILEKAKGEREIAELRLKAKDLNKTTAKEREEALRKVISIQDELTNKEIKAAELRRDAVVEENKLSKSNKDALTAEAEAEAKLIQLQTAKANKARTVQSEITAAENAARSERQAKGKEAEAAEALAAKEKAAALEEIRVGQINTEDEKRKEELRKVEEQYKKLLEQAKKYYGEDSEQAQALITSKDEKLKEIQTKFDEEDKARQDKIDQDKKDKELKDQEEKIAKLELDKENDNLKFEQQRELIRQREELLAEDKKLTDEQKLELKKQFAEKSNQIDKEEAEAKAAIQAAYIDVADRGIQLLKDLAGDNVGLQKALLIAESASGIAKILVNTNAANAAAVLASPLTAGQPFVTLNQVSAGIGIASTIAATAKGLGALNSSGLGSGGGSAPTASSLPTQPQAPNFNIVGATETSQLAEAIGDQTQQPVQAYVVANDVTTAQSLNNNIVEGASIG